MNGHRNRNPKPIESSALTAKRYLVWLLSRREYAEAELRQKALLKGYERSHVDEALSFVKERGYQDDARYAGMKVRSTAARWGDRRISQALKEKRISDQVITEQLAGADSEEDRAWALVDKHLKADFSMELSAKLWRRLASRGFNPGVIQRVLKRLRAGDQ
jgi:regulatory protein